MSVQLAISPCPNDTFIFHAWVHGLVPHAPPVSVSYADVDRTNGWAAAGRGDVLKVSYAALPWLADRYALLPAGGALGRGCGPLLLTADGSLPAGATVAVPAERSTAYLLLRMWAAEREPLRVRVVPFDRIMPGVRDGRFAAGPVIHEARFTYPRYGLREVADLGAWWQQQTGLPIPLGAVVARRELDPAGITEAIRGSLRHAWADPAASRDYVLRHAQEMQPEVVDAHIRLYVTDQSMRLDDEGRAAVAELFRRASAARLLPEVPAGRLVPV